MWRIRHLAVFASLLSLPALAFVLHGCGQDATEPCATAESEPRLQCGIGACYALIERCRDGQPQNCGPLVAESAETPDGFDNDCNGVVDDGIPCDTFETQDCYTGSPIYAGKGLCQYGIQICQQGTWSFCTGDVMPQEELCNQRDDDCDGDVDEDCSCLEGAGQSCYSGPQGTEVYLPCRMGQQTCTNGRWGTCESEIVPALELHDGSDNDCDGRIDEDFPCQIGEVQDCYSGPPNTRGMGRCQDGKQPCMEGAWGDCIGQELPKPEECNNFDDDCDGTVNNGQLGQDQSCTTGLLGICSQGKTQCLNNEIACVPELVPQAEQCNGVDDNCDGDIDLNPVTKKPLTGALCSIPLLLGACVVGVDTCEGAQVICKQKTFPTAEVCNNADDDCDGIVNNGSLCCPNFLKDGSESDVDCGGVCGSTCLSGQSCFQDLDCQSQVCGADKICQPPKCDDLKKNGTESDLDCGGICPKCSDFKLCNISANCQSGVCTLGICQPPNCNDITKNGIETDIDCGGTTCPKCVPEKTCGVNSDCDSAICQGGFCQAPQCNDSIKNGFESDIDCGGPACAGCNAGKACVAGADCQNSVCTNNICQSPNCIDNAKNGTESDVDCGGPACPDCSDGRNCVISSDCASSVCAINICQPPSCFDGVKNGIESDVDCGGPACADCGPGKTCFVGADCQSGVCSNDVCN